MVSITPRSVSEIMSSSSVKPRSSTARLLFIEWCHAFGADRVCLDAVRLVPFDGDRDHHQTDVGLLIGGSAVLDGRGADRTLPAKAVADRLVGHAHRQLRHP